MLLCAVMNCARTIRILLPGLAAAAILLLNGCGEPQRDYFPLESGRWWYFETRTTRLEDPQDQRLIVANIGPGTKDGQAVFIQRQSAGREVYFARNDEGLIRSGVREHFAAPQKKAPPASLVLPRDLTVGATWTTQTRLTLIESRTFARQDKLQHRSLPLDLNMSIAALDESINVRAGKFSGCLRIDGSGIRRVRTDRGNASAEVLVTHQEWYAPGIGLIKTLRSETAESPFLTAGFYSQELIQYE